MADRLQPSDRDLVLLCEAVDERYQKVQVEHQRHLGYPLFPPSHLATSIIRIDELVNRYHKGDFRHTESEKKALREVAQWTLDVHRRLNRQEPVKLQWKD